MIRLKLLDFVIIFSVLLITIILTLIIYSGYNLPGLLKITSESDVYFFTLDTDRTVQISGPIGNSEIRIEAGSAFFTDSPCHDKLCVKTGHLNKTGDWAGCLPNKVFISIVKNRNSSEETINETDSVSY